MYLSFLSPRKNILYCTVQYILRSIHPTHTSNSYCMTFRDGGVTVVAPVRAEPRAWLANERTFLSWMQAASTLVVVSSAIVTAADYPYMRLVGIMLAAPAMLFVLQATLLYYMRRHQLERRSVGTYTNRFGPYAMCVLTTVVVVMNITVNLYRSAAVITDRFDFSKHKFHDPAAVTSVRKRA